MADRNASDVSGSSGGFVAGIILTVAGLVLLSPVMLIIGIVLIVRNRGIFAGKTEEPAARRSAPQKPGPSTQPRPLKPVPHQPSGASYNSYAQDHHHITAAGLSAERRLEQLEVMKKAGLLDKEEYEQRLRKILRDK